MDISKIANKMTREEFLNSCYINNENGISYCPGIFDLKNFPYHICNPKENCKECWKNAIKDIKFKGENCMEFNWDEFKKGKVAVFCKNTKLKKDFLQKCTDVGLTCYHGSTKPINHCTSYDNIPYCYAYDTPLTSDLAYDTIEYFIKNNYKIVKWEIEKGENGMDIDITPAAKKAENMLNDLTTNKIDYDIHEVMEFPIGTILKCNIDKNEYEIINCFGNKLIGPKNGNSVLSLSSKWINAKFKLVKKDKKVSFEEAIQAYGKEVYCIWNDGESKTEYRIESPLHGIRDVEFKKDITSEEILNGEWYIKEE
ncbi:hypothetical protein [Clostridium botulinum]|uniref:Uncharacterized protein n=1 Tax=Clostridium botulinum B2 450 TaxID=1379739 RepID=A0A0D1BTE8_CLOBO|nr:hypothetical protein [Clostridium botulinum]KIS22036.1 hypothetical protein N495_16230 [Clostridium botulinum B2 450]